MLHLSDPSREVSENDREMSGKSGNSVVSCSFFQETRGFLDRRTVNVREPLLDDMPDLADSSDDESPVYLDDIPGGSKVRSIFEPTCSNARWALMHKNSSGISSYLGNHDT